MAFRILTVKVTAAAASTSCGVRQSIADEFEETMGYRKCKRGRFHLADVLSALYRDAGRARGSGHQAAGCAARLLLLSCSTAVHDRAKDPASPHVRSEMITALPAGVRVTQMALGYNHTCALLESGRVACWGDNGRGQLGNGSDQPSFSPVLVPDVFGAVEIRANDATTCVRQQTGAVSCWGDNSYGQAIPKFEPALKSAPTPWATYDSSGEPPRFTAANVLRVATANDLVAGARRLSLGDRHGCALYEEGRVTCWGDASLGQLGVGPPPDAYQVQTIIGLPALVEIDSDRAYSCGRTAAGGVWCWGSNDQAQLGSPEPGPGPRQVPGVTDAVALELASDRACARLSRGQVICWGDSLDCGDIDSAWPPTRANNLDDSIQFVRAPAGCFWCILGRDHQLKCDGDPISEIRIVMPGVATVAAGVDHACAARFDGSVWCWGSNPRGELGRQTPNVRAPDPAPVLWPSQIEHSRQQR